MISTNTWLIPELKTEVSGSSRLFFSVSLFLLFHLGGFKKMDWVFSSSFDSDYNALQSHFDSLI